MKRGIAVVSLIALGVWFGLRSLSSRRPMLAPADFTAGGPDALEFCDPRNPRFLAVVDKRSAVVMTGKAPDQIHLATADGKPIGPQDLVDQSLRVFAVDDAVNHFASGAAVPGRAEGDWIFPFRGARHLFADFAPNATGQEMYAAAVLPGDLPAEPAPTAQENAIALSTLPRRIFSRQPVEVLVQMSDPVGQAELSVFDVHAGGPTGFVVRSPDRVDDRVMRFTLKFPDPGKYVLWVQAGVGAAAKFRRFETEVAP
jgi:hypothetical protein